MVDAEVASLVSERSKLRAEKLYDAADEIHKILLNLGFEVIDKADGGTDVSEKCTSDAAAPKHVEWYQLPLPTPALHSSPPASNLYFCRDMQFNCVPGAMLPYS
ncbi:hypothetical protein TrCOL_g3172 [Triparma columacea]|uniref:Uncharacterized protein n=1 Tax=Triparma columacea TaxID=722753 RepID=A0A9W7FYN6_9STRA|nr:hypothetical protein TrCOL_g3172 [Triparma columacea]